MRTAAAWLVVVAGVCALWYARVERTHAIPIWSASAAEGLLKSDPALLYWFTSLHAGSTPAVELAHTTAVQWPEAVDARVEFPQAQMWLAGHTWRWFGSWFGSNDALHEWCVLLFSLLAAAAGLGVYGLARELSGSRVLGVIAFGTWALLPASWRTTGYVLLGEDLSFPAFCVHLWLLARAARVRTRAAFLLAGLALLVAMMSWHAAGFFVAMEAGVLLAWSVRSGANPLRVRHAWLTLVPLLLGCALEPMLRGKLQLFSLPVQLAAVMAALAWWEGRRARAELPALTFPARVLGALGLMSAAAGLAFAASRALGGGLGDYSHVFGLIAAKLRHLGELPSDPLALPFEVRILWQGPFETLPPRALVLNLSTALLGVVVLGAASLPTWWRGRGAAREALLALFGAVALLAAWLILRTAILAAVLCPVAAVVFAARWQARRPRLVAGLAALLLVAPPLALFGPFLRQMPRANTWYNADHARELRALLGALRQHVPAGESVASDEVNSTAILAHTGHPILVQPKYEWAGARARLGEYREVATRGTPAELARYLGEHRTRFLAYDWRLLWSSRYQAGIPESVNGMQPETALAQAVGDPRRLPGFELLWKSPGGRFLLYRLASER